MKDAIGLEIGSSGVRAARVSFSRHAELEAFHQAPLPAGAVQDGEISDPQPVEKAVAEAVGEVGRSKSLTLAVANQKVVARIAELPHIDERELRNAIRYQVQDLIPIPMDSAVLDFQVLQEFTNEDQDRMIRVLVVAAHQDMINSFLETIGRAGVSPEAIDFTPLALMRSLGATEGMTFEQERAGEALIDVGTEVSSMVVRQKEVPKLARVLAVGGNEEPGRLVDELRGSIRFYAGQSEDAGMLARAVLSGEAGNLELVAPLLSDALGLPVEVGNVLRSVKASKRLVQKIEAQKAGPLLAIAVGAALGACEQ